LLSSHAHFEGVKAELYSKNSKKRIFTKGILTITLPKVEKVQRKQVKIKVK